MTGDRIGKVRKALRVGVIGAAVLMAAVLGMSGAVYAQEPTTTFIGTDDGNWSNENNWDNGFPDSGTIAIIDTEQGGDGDLEVIFDVDAAECLTLTIQSGTLNMGGGELLVYGTMIVETFFTQSDGVVYLYDLDVNGTVEFKGGSVTYNAPTGSHGISPQSYNTLIVNAGATYTFGGATEARWDFQLFAGTINAGATAISVGRSWQNLGGTFNSGTSTFNFTDGNAATLGGLQNTTFYNLVINKSVSATVTLGRSIVINNNLTITAGTLSASVYSITLYGNWTNNSVFTAGSGTVSFVGTASKSILGSTASIFNHVVLDKQDGGPSPSDPELPVEGEFPVENAALQSDDLVLGNNILVAGDFTITDGEFKPGTYSATFQKSFYNNGGLVTPGTSTLLFTGSSAAVIGGTLPVAMYNMTVNKSGAGSVSLQQSILVNNAFLLTAGTVTQATATFTIYGNWTKNGGSFSYGTYTVVFGGALSTTVGGSSGSSFYNVTIAKSSNTPTVAFSSGVSVYNNVLITQGDFNPGPYLQVYGNWTKNGGLFAPSSGTVSISGPNDATIGGSSPSSFYNLTIAKGSATAFLTNNSTVAAWMLMSSGRLNYSGAGPVPGVTRTLNVPGTKVTFSGSENQELDFGSAYGTFYEVEVNKSGGTATVSVSTTTTVFSGTYGLHVGAGGITFTQGAVVQSNSTNGIYTTGSITFADSAGVTLTSNGAAVAFHGNWTKGASSVYTPNAGWTFVYGSSDSNISASNFASFGIAKTGGGTTHATGNWTVTDLLIVWEYVNGTQANYLELESHTHSIGSILARGVPEVGNTNLGKISFESSTVTITGAGGIDTNPLTWGDTPTQQYDFGTSTIIYGMNANANLPTRYTLNNLEINPSSNAVTISLSGTLTLAGNLTLSAGIMDVTPSNYALNVGGNVTKGGGNLQPRTGILTFVTGADVVTVSGNSLAVYTVVIAKSSVSVQPVVNWQSANTLQGALIVSSGHFNLKAGCAFNGDIYVGAGGGLVLSTNAQMEFPVGHRVMSVDGGLFEVSPASGVALIYSQPGDDAYLSMSTANGATVDVDRLYVDGLELDGWLLDEANILKFENVEFGPCYGNQCVKFKTTSTLTLTCPGVVFDPTIVDNGGYNVAIEDKTLNNDSYLIFEALATSGAGAGDDYDFDGDKGDSGDVTAGDGYSDYGEGVINWVTGKVFSIKSIVSSPGSDSRLLGHPKPVIDFNTFSVIGYVMGLIDVDTDGNDAIVMVNVSGEYVDCVYVDDSLGDLTGIAVATANEKGTGADIDGDGISDEDELQTLVYGATDQAVIFRRLIVSDTKFDVCGAPSGWFDPYDGSGEGLVSFSSPPTADNTNVYCGVIDSKGVYCLVWLDHGDASRKLGKSQTPDSCPALQTSLLIQPVDSTPKAFAGTDTSDEDGSAHLYRIDVGVDLIIELDTPITDPVLGVPALRNNQITVGTSGGEVITVNYSSLAIAGSFLDEASPVNAGVFVNHLSQKYFGNANGTLYSLDSTNNQRYSVPGLGGAIDALPLAAAGVVFVPVDDTLFQVADNPSNPAILKRVTGNGKLSSVIVNSFHPDGPKVVTLSEDGYFVQY